MGSRLRNRDTAACSIRSPCWRTATLALGYVIGLAGICDGLRLVRLDMPSAVIRGDPLWLNCSFDLESDELYSVKWYKNNREFFRYLPNENPPGQAYRLSGVHVDVSRSSVGSLYLKETDLKSEGLYACEVSADAPSFQTIRSEKELKIYVLPKKGPEIRGTKPHYRFGDAVNVTCRAGASKPPAVLVWYINGEQVPPSFEKVHPILRDEDQLYHSSLGVTFTAEPRHFTYGIMKLKCTATVSEAYSLSSEEIVAAQDAKSTRSEDDKPSITGGQTSYHVGDLVNVTCSYSRYGRPIELQWQLNDKEVSNRYLVHYPIQRHESGRQVTSLGLRFTVRPSHFVHDEMRIKCMAVLSGAGRSSSASTSSSSAAAGASGDSYSEREFVLGSSHRSSGLHVPGHYGAVADSNDSPPLTLGTFTIQSSATLLLLTHLRTAS
ncbi:synaptogenesis protein syg-2 [Rhipicephalus sanguineus]|uniref:synaptogenesis protein syg-2 n=1 Tax=Rhipicephalus sanguineus TaxID=34632 RepID=UPI0018959097|nr:synaptogenesis protein syg-2 [Rhipicephalus sanguineus]